MTGWRYAVAAVVLAAGCTGPEYSIHESRDDARAIKTQSGPAAGAALDWHGAGRLSLERKRLNVFSSEMTDIGEEISALHRTVSGKKIEHYSMDEHGRIESMLFRYLVCREALWDVASYYGKRSGLFAGRSDQVKGFIIAYSAALKVHYIDTKMVVDFIDEPVTISKLNAGYADCRIPGGSFDRIFHIVTSVDHLEAMEAAWTLFREQADDPKSRLAKVARAEPEYGALVREIRTQRLYAKAQTDRLLDKTSILFPNMENRLRQSKVAELAAGTKEAVKSGLGACGALVGNAMVKLVKSPLAVEVQWNRGDLNGMFRLAQPGDILLTMREGYLSNLFIPGEFKHGITFVGSVAKRRAAGLSKQALSTVPSQLRQRTSGHLFQSKDAAGDPANCVEAIAEGVIMTSTRRLTRVAVNRVLILRPVLPPEERVRQLAAVFSRLDDGYDFKFNFVDQRKLCCTELIYRSLNGRGLMSFSLVKRMGLPTLSADDIIRTYFKTMDAGHPTFEFVALAEEDPTSAAHGGRILTGDAGLQRLRVIMNLPAPRADGSLTQWLTPPAGAGPPLLSLVQTRPAARPPLYSREPKNWRSLCSIPSLPSY
ncbi:MAG: hypothetical protein HN919_17875 [Verrucomicrobia bacterium]|jgi:hypothetical protein|nr:hypothetical protein [Verrucomicrobiota bacterium]MBT7068169.1 hypothetical protein [Verrucomicrobiota bacterium]MBT7700425.1 hypothetical protein [Verrucomicrobiota bacterium]